MSYIASATAILLSFVSLSDAHTQGIGGFCQPSMPAGMSAANCERLEKIPIRDLLKRLVGSP